MDRIQLKTWLDEGLSLDQIGAIVGRDPSTVGYWLRKHGLTANGRAKHAPKGGIRRQDLEPLVAAGETLVTIAEKLGVSTSTVRYWIARYELPRPHRVRRSEVEKAIAEGRRTVWRDCGKHGWTSS